MALEKFTLGSLAKMDDGRLAIVFAHALKRIEDDCRDRPGVVDPRKITLNAILAPQVDQSGNLVSIDVKFEVNETIPKRSTQTYNMAVTRAGILYNEMSPDDVNQATLDFSSRPRDYSDESDIADDDDNASQNRKAGTVAS